MMQCRPWIFGALVVAALAPAGCADAGGGTEGDGDESFEAPALRDLSGASVTLSYMDSLTVVLEEGGASDPVGGRIVLLAAYSARGDFDSDGSAETAALIAADPPGSAIYTSLVAFRRGPDGLEQVADKLLGDRQEVHRLETVGDSLRVELTTHGPGDAVCCPTRRAEQIYRMVDGTWRLWRDNTLAAPEADAGSPAPDEARGSEAVESRSRTSA